MTGMDREAYFDEWSKLHGGYDPRGSALVRGWLTVVHGCARPFVRLGIHPDLVTLMGVGVSGLALALAALGGYWPAVAGLLIAASGLTDSLDGAVAIQTGRTSRWGFVLDSVADRVAEVLFAFVLVAIGGPGWLAGVAIGLAWLQEYMRARAMAAGMDEVGVVTIWEKPTRVIVTTMFALGAAIYQGQAQIWALVGLAVWAGLGLIGFGQLSLAVRARLSGPGGGDGPPP